MQSKATTVKEYLDSLPEDRRKALNKVRKVIKQNLPKGYKEGMQYGMIGYFVPHSIYPYGYHCNPKEPLPFAALASQKNHMAMYLSCVYGHEGTQDAFRKAWEKTGKKLDMGKSCVRFKKVEDLALDVIGDTIAKVPVDEYIEFYETAIVSSSKTAAKKLEKAKAAHAKKR